MGPWTGNAIVIAVLTGCFALLVAAVRTSASSRRAPRRSSRGGPFGGRSLSRGGLRAGTTITGLLVAASAAAWSPAVAGAADTDTGRGYEQVSPVDKDYRIGGLDGDFDRTPLLSARDGGAALFEMTGPLPGAMSGTTLNYYLARRGATGWDAKSIIPAETMVPGTGGLSTLQAVSPDLSKQVLRWANSPLVPGVDPDELNLFLGDTTTGSWRLLSTVPGGLTRVRLVFQGASADWSHVVFSSTDPYLGEAGSLFFINENVNGELRSPAILPDGTSTAVGSRDIALDGAVSADGSRIVFALHGGQIYVRINGVSTVVVSASQRSTPDPNGIRTPRFGAASVDGNRIFFSSPEALTDDANLGTTGGGDLYEFDVDSKTLTDLTVDTNPADAATGAGVQQVVGASDDGSYVYFVASGDLGGGATSGAPNLYLWHAGAVRFIATLDWADLSGWSDRIRPDSTRITPDGRHLVWTSVAPLAGYHNADAVTGTPDSELYRYAADADTLTCVSCHSDGSAPQSSVTLGTSVLPSQRNLPRQLTDDGRSVFFDTTDALVASDTNGKRDVYEWVDGSAHLVSDGVSRHDAFFGDASADGTDVMFHTRARLVPEDTDDYADAYDARRGGGFAHVTASKSCTTSDCRPSAGTQDPGRGEPGSSLLSGVGDAKPAVRFSLREVSAAARRTAARNGRLVLPVYVSTGGRVSAAATAKVGGRSKTISRGQVTARGPGVVHVALRLSRDARAVLARGRTLRVALKVTYSKTSGARAASLTLHR
ncbi:MAG TPA: hypothetical protein VI318_06245 [Baekduia sp.]